MRKYIEIYDRKENRVVRGEFRPVRELDSGDRLGYFESAEYANLLAIMVLHPDGTYFIAERLEGMSLHGGS
jgi:hypothetical protein